MSKEAIRKGRRIVLLSVFALVLITTLRNTTRAFQTADVKIVVNRSVEIDQLKWDDVSRIYLGKKTLWDSGARIKLSMLNEKSPVTQDFLESGLRKTVQQFRAYWKRRLFSGGGAAPKTFSTSSQVLDFVASNEGSIGVVESSANDDRVLVVSVK